MTDCTYLRCPTPAVVRIEPPNSGRPWFGCPEHAPAMDKALSIGAAASQSAAVIPL